MTAARDLRPELFVKTVPPRLVCSRCTETDQLFYPIQAMNPVTSRAGTMVREEVEGGGKLLNFTHVVRGMPGFASPFALGVIELDAGPTITAQLTEWKDCELSMGMRVELVIGEIKRDADATVVIGPMFKPVKGKR